MKRTGDVIIVGGGVIGLTTAYFLAREGVRVLLCEQGRTGMESSWAGAGILPPCDLEHARHPFDRLRGLSARIFPDLSRELQERTGIDNGFTRSGGIEFLAHSAATSPERERRDTLAPSHRVGVAHDEWHGEGVPTSWLSELQVRELEPALAPDVGPAVHLPTMAQLRNPRHMQALRAACLSTGNVAIREETSVVGFVSETSRVKGVRAGDEVLAGDAFVAAAGAWSDRLLQTIGCRLSIEPVRGQIALLNPGRVVFSRILVCGARYLVPRQDGRVLIGSTEEHVGFDKATTAEGIRGLLELGVRLVPELGSAALEKTWAGLRPGSPDGLPFIGTLAPFENLHVAAGHFRAGIQLSPGTALVLKERILGQPLSMALDAFRLDRGEESVVRGP